ncbi:hypothetical protein [Shewanella sp. DAU305]|uniref:hypothetical protein n=1 Tax=Shewanella sp. DAU305 TaxID=2991940 RepID=UPI002283A630|nr:hypothetical protein [Shewanella sp. DAU305]WAL79823.1 hypothetical protein OX890_06665 [Shewanella sp. DAU305]
MSTVKDENAESNYKFSYTERTVNSPPPKGFQENHLSYFSLDSDCFPTEFKSPPLLNFNTKLKNNDYIPLVNLNFDIQKSLSKEDNLDFAAKKIYHSLRNYPFEQGFNSFADIELMSLKNEVSEADFYLLLPKIWTYCYSSRTTIEALHFLNCLLNLARDIDTDAFCLCGVAAVSHKDLEIKEAGIALFEKMRNPKYCSTLENVGDTGIDWLDQYRLDVIDELRKLS